MTINSPFTVGSVLTAAQMNNMPFGLLGQSTGVATTSYTANTPLTILSLTVTIQAGRLYRLTASCGFQPSANSASNALYMTCSGVASRTFWYQQTTISANLPLTRGGTILVSSTDFGVTSGSASKTINFVIRCGGNGALNTNPDGIVGANSSPQFLTIEDVGSP
jgi:hypothetical protein